MAAGQHSWYSNLLWARWSRDQILVGVIIAMSIKDQPRGSPASSTVCIRSFLGVKQGADHLSPCSTQIMNWLELHLVTIHWRFFYVHNNGTYSDFCFQYLWMDWEKQKHDLLLKSMKTSQVSHNSVHYTCHFISVLYNLIYFGACPNGRVV
jgi:hypothetical protein